MFDFGVEGTVPWKLVVIDIARYLAGCGIEFCTLASRAQIPISLVDMGQCLHGMYESFLWIPNTYNIV
jgi:hypothetical protein